MLVLKTSMPSSAAAGSFAKAVWTGWVRHLVSISHRSLALFGLLTVMLAVVLGGRADVRDDLEHWTLDWLLTRQEARDPASEERAAAAPEAAEPVEKDTAGISPAPLDREQKAVASWIAKRYRVAPEPIGSLVQEAWQLGRQAKLEPTLILAVMAVESSFNPFAQSAVGAQGLMQVMTTVHDDKYQAFGGTHAAFNPVANLRVGVTVLKECVLRAGSMEGGLRLYVGAANLEDDGGYAAKVIAEQTFLREVAQGRTVPVGAKWTPSTAPGKGPAITEAASSTPQASPRRLDGATGERVALLQ